MKRAAGIRTDHGKRRRWRCALGLGLGVCAGGAGLAQTVGVTDSVASFSKLEAATGGWLSDPTYDQQTGQGADDFVGDGTGGYYGFYYKFGQMTVSNTAVDTMVFRFRLNVLDLKQGEPNFTGNFRLGVDGDGDGDVDLYFGVSTGSGQTTTIGFQNPEAGKLNVSPSTSGLGNVYGAIATTAANFNYAAVTDGSAYGTGKGLSSDADAFLTFAIPFATFKAYLEAQLPGKTITLDSYLRFVAFSSTQANAVNQDVYGVSGVGATRYDQGGGFTNFYSSRGRVVPEPATAAQLGMVLASGWWVAGRRRGRG